MSLNSFFMLQRKRFPRYDVTCSAKVELTTNIDGAECNLYLLVHEWNKHCLLQSSVLLHLNSFIQTNLTLRCVDPVVTVGWPWHWRIMGTVGDNESTTKFATDSMSVILNWNHWYRSKAFHIPSIVKLQRRLYMCGLTLVICKGIYWEPNEWLNSSPLIPHICVSEQGQHWLR